MIQIAQEAKATCDYKSIFEHRKALIRDPEVVGATSLSFELDCDFIFLQTDNIRLINRLSSLRPKAYLIVFSNEKKVENAVTINFGVYCYPKDGIRNPIKFIEVDGKNYGFEAKGRNQSFIPQGRRQQDCEFKMLEIN